MRESKKDLRALLNEAEFRAGRNFEKLMRIENIIRKADENNEMAIFTLQDIKRELAMLEH